MVTYRGLLWVSVVMLVPACTGFPTQAESTMNIISSIVNIAQTTLVHIRKLRTMLPADPPIKVAAPTIGGLNSIARDLSLLGDQLRVPASGLLGQILADVASLSGCVRFLAETLGCRPPDDDGLAGDEGPVASGFAESRVYVGLTMVQVYLDELLLSQDKLRAC